VDYEYFNNDDAVQNPDGTTNVVVVLPIDPDGPEPENPVAKVTCRGCGDWCWVLYEEERIALTTTHAPVCIPCMTRFGKADVVEEILQQALKEQDKD
jgi:hypothetical protein